MKTQKWKIFKPPLLSPSSYPCHHRPLLLLSLQPSSIWIERDREEAYREEARLWPGQGAHRGGSWRLVCVVFGWWENGGNKRREKWVFGGMGFLDCFAMWDFESWNLRWSVICFGVWFGLFNCWERKRVWKLVCELFGFWENGSERGNGA